MKVKKLLPLIILVAVCLINHSAFAQPGALDTSFNPADLGFGYGDGFNGGGIRSIVSQPDGKVLIGGGFTSYNGTARSRIARLNPDGSLDGAFNLGAGANNSISSVVYQSDGKVLIGGDFTSYNGTGRNRIARLNADGSLDESFNPGTGVNATVWSIAYQPDGKVLIGGSFNTYNGTTRNGIARLNADGSLDGSFNPGGAPNIRVIAHQADGKVLIGGFFLNYNGTGRNFLVRLNADGSVDVSFNPVGGEELRSMVCQPDGKILVGGWFTTYSGISLNRIARLNADGSADVSFNPGTGATSVVHAIALQSDNKILIGGDFVSINGIGRNRIARLNADGSLDGNFNPGLGANNTVQSIVSRSDGKVLIGGNFNSFNGIVRNFMAPLNANGSLDVTFAPGTGANNALNSIVYQPDNKILIGGQFSIYNGIPRNFIARLNTDGSLDASFDPGLGANSSIFSIAYLPDGKVLIGGQFTSYNGIARNRIARLNADGSLDESFNPGGGANNLVLSIAHQPDGKILIVGFFDVYNGTGRSRIARLNADGSLDASFDPGSGANSLINTIVCQPDGKVLIGGAFSSYNSTARGRIARLNSDGSLDASFNSVVGANSGVQSIVCQPDGKVLIGGDFDTYNGTGRSRIARLNADGSLDASFNPGTGANSTVQSMVYLPDGKVLIAGDLFIYNGIGQNRIARLNGDGGLDASFNPGTGVSSIIRSIIYQPNGKILIGGFFTSYNGVGRNRIARINGDPPLPTNTVTSADSLALVSLYNSTNGPSWFNKTNWLTGKVNTWYGITTANNRVTEINLASNNLTFFLPNLSNLTGLKKLDLGSNNFNPQPIPVSLNNLTSLEYLDLRNGRFNGIITSLDSLNNLKYFSLHNNIFLSNQIFPAFVLGLENLETLLLSSCRLQGAIPAGFNNLTHLKELNLSANLGLGLTGPPLDELGSLQEMSVLNLSGVGLGGILPTVISSLPNLIDLDVSSSALTSLPANSAWVSDTLQVNISNNLLDFGDLEPLVGVSFPTFINTGQAPFQLYPQGAGTLTKLLEGDPFILTPVVNGTQNNYQWYFNNSPISGATNLTLNLGNLEISESGIYRLQVTSTLVTGVTLISISQTLTVVAGAESRYAKVTGSVISNEVQSNSNGGYWADMDNDGDEDLFVNNSFNDIPNFLYENLGNGTFGKITTGDIVNIIDGPRYASWGDYDNDGYADIFVGEYTNANLSPTNDNISSLYHNNGNKTFTRIPINHKADGGLWADYDNDGDLDLFLNATTIAPAAAKLYKNNGGGNLELIDNWVPVSGTWYSGFVDIDNDGDLDYNTTPGTASNQIKIFRNSDSTFIEENLPVPAGSFSHRGSSWGDIDGDGDMDLFAMNAQFGIAGSGVAESQFYINDGAGNFTMQAVSARMGAFASGARGSSFADADNDGDLDLFVIHRPSSASVDIITQLFLNNGSGMFTAVPQSEQSFGFSEGSTGLSVADYDNDGAQDLFIGSFDPARPNYLYRNLQGSNGYNWLKLKLVGVESNKTAIGARIDFYVGGQRFNRQILPSSGLSGQNSYIVHSGLAGSIKADSVVINWPSGTIERLRNVQANQLLTVIEGVSDDLTVTTADSLALVSLYNSTNGASWANKTNWLTGKVNTWYGITVDSSRVTEINLNANNLSSVLPDLSNLTGLKKLDIGSNILLTLQPIPASINNLTSLEYLDLSNSRFNGIITSLDSLNNLKYFSLSNNTFLSNQVFPTFVLGLENLETLLLSNCRLQGTIPPGFNNLTHLKELNLSANLGLGLFGVPLEEIGTLQEMQVLNLSGVGLGTFLPTVIASLPNLVSLNVSSCGLNVLPANSDWVSDSLQVNISNNLLDFADLELLVEVSSPTFINTGQNPFLLFPQGTGNTKLLVGDPFILTPVVNGTQNSYQWYTNNVNPIPGATNLTLDLGNLEISESGNYRLQVTSALVSGITLVSTSQILTVVVGAESRYAKVTGSVISNEVQANSNGGYWADMDNDGDEDLFVNNSFNDIPNFLYENLGDGTFGKITTGDIVNIIDGPRYSSWGDYDNDGYIDIFVGEYTNAQNSPTNDNISSLYHNNGNKTFTRIPFNHKADGSLWADYDNDGDLDLFLNLTNTNPAAAKLYKNNGGGNFELIDNWVPASGTWYAGFVDIDNDGDLDYNVTPFTLINQIKIFRNNNGTFVEENLPVPAGNFSHRGSSWGDIDGDGDMDLFAMNATPGPAGSTESQFYINDGAGNFTMQAASTRLGVPASGARGSSFSDADNDGDLDLFVIHRPSFSSIDISTQLFLNNGSGMFTAVPQSEQSFGFSDPSTGLSVADYDNDGAQDLFIGSFDPARPNYLYRNLQGSNGNNWLKLKLVGVQSNKTAIGARVDFYAGSQRFNRQILPSSGLSGQNSYVVHSGLAASTQADSIVINWPSGVITRLLNVQANQQLTVIEDEGGTEHPTVPASDIDFSNVLSTSMEVSFNAGDGMKHLAVMKQGSAPSFIPLDDVSYTGDLGNGETVVYDGDSTAFTLTNLSQDTEYFITVFEYNEGSGNKYLVIDAPVDSQRTLFQPNVYVTSPVDSAVNQVLTLNVTARTLTGATTYTIELNDASDFTGNSFVKSGTRTQNFTGLSYATRYYTRVKTNLSPAYGKTTTFSTRIPNIYVTAPADSAVNQPTTLSVTAASLTGATLYTIELNESYNFSGVGFVQTGTRTQSFTGLKNNQRYYTRVKTDNYPVYGPITSFTTAVPNVYVTTPANNAINQNVTLNISARTLTGATTYTIELNEAVDFSGEGFIQTGSRTQSFTGLSFGTEYFARVKTNLSPVYGKVTSFTTANAANFAYVTSPANNAINLSTTLNITSNSVPGATQYTIQLSETLGFDTIAFEVTGPTRTLAFSGLKYNKTYYNRVLTNVTASPGQVRSFSTRTAESISYVASPANNAVNVNTSLNISSNTVPGATEYIIQLSESPSFDTIRFERIGSSRVLAFSGLKYNKTYYNRVRTNFSAPDDWGPIRSFKTRTAESLAYVTSPANGAVDRKTKLSISSNTVPGASSYTIQLSEDSLFSIIAFEVIGPTRTLAFSGLNGGTKYYNRVTTNAQGTIGFGQVRSFTTIGVPPGARLSSTSSPVDQVETEEQRVVAEELKEFDVRIYPNPFREKLVLYIEARVEKQAIITLMDVNGKAVHESVEQTNTTVEIEKPLAVGVYLLRVRAGSQYKMIRVVKSE